MSTRAVYDEFVERAVALTKTYVLGNPLDEATTLGPMVKADAAEFVRGQIAEAVRAGAKALIDPKSFANDKRRHALYGAADRRRRRPPDVADARGKLWSRRRHHAGRDDEEAVRADERQRLRPHRRDLHRKTPKPPRASGHELETGTVFLNRCDYLDPALAWTGVKDTGRGVTLSALGYETLTRPKSFHFKLP